MGKADDSFDPSRPRVQLALNQLENAIGGREALVESLTVVDDPEVEYLLGLVADPRNDTKPLGELCDQGNITPEQLLKAYRKGRLARKQVEAIHLVTDGTPAVAADILKRAVRHERYCSRCHGTGLVVDDKNLKQTCQTCDGSGQVKAEASLEHQKLALELAGLLVKGSGTSVNVGVQVGESQTRVASLGQLQQAVQQVLATTPRPALPEPVVIDAEMVERSQL